MYAFLHVTLLEDTSKFSRRSGSRSRRRGTTTSSRYRTPSRSRTRSPSLALELDVTVAIIGLLDQGTPLANALLYLLLGTGGIGYAVRSIFVRQRQTG